MITRFISRFESRKSELEAFFSEKHPIDYKEIVTKVVEILKPGDENKDYEYYYPDPTRIHQIDDGDYQGTLIFIIASTGYQPYQYWYVKVAYGSCSGCDTLEDIREYAGRDEKPNEKQVKDYMTLALHIVQNIGAMQEED